MYYIVENENLNVVFVQLNEGKLYAIIHCFGFHKHKGDSYGVPDM